MKVRIVTIEETLESIKNEYIPLEQKETININNKIIII